MEIYTDPEQRTIMADPVYGIHQSQPRDVFGYMKANAQLIGLTAKTGMLSDFNGPLEPNTTEIFFDDTVEYYDEKLLDGRTRRYSLVTAYTVAVEPRAFVGVPAATQVQIEKLGYTKVQSVSTYASPASFASAIGRDESDVALISGAAKTTFLAGIPRYFGPDSFNPEDVPQTGSQYARTNTGWQEIDLSQYETTQGTDDKIDAALGSTFNSRNVLLTSDTSVFADGEGAVSDPAGGAGWYYKNTTGNKINWYFYSGGSDTENLGALQAAGGGYYALVEARNTTSFPMYTIYTKRENDGNDASWYRSRLVYSPGGDYANKLSLGTHVLHTPNLKQSVLDDLAVKNPGATFTQLEIDPFSTVGPQQTTEELWLMAVSTSSNEPEGQETFVLKENAIFFNSKARSWQYAAIPTQQPEYTNYYKGAYALAADYPESGQLGQWIINSTDDTMLVWDVEGGDWVATGSNADAPNATVNDYPFQYIYSSLDGSGYGFKQASPASDWENTPDGRLQATGSGTSILSYRVQFATLKNPGDEVTMQLSDNTNVYNRYVFYGLTAGTLDSDQVWSIGGGPSNGVAWMSSDADTRDRVEFQMSYLEPYFGGTTYGYNLADARNSTGYGYTGNAGELPVTFRVADDYRIQIYIDGTYYIQTATVPPSGVDIWVGLYGSTGRILSQPTGNGANFIGGTAPNASGARYFMSAVATPATATELASGGGYFLYSDTVQGDASDCELTSSEAGSARFSRVFVDYTGMTVTERADETYPIVIEDEKVLDRVEYLARGYFHSLDLDVPIIQSKMAEFAQALEAATAGSVEVCLVVLQGMLASTTEPVLCQELIDLLAKHLQKFPR